MTLNFNYRIYTRTMYARKQLYEIRVYFVFSRTGFKTSQSQQCEVSLYFQQSSYKPHSAGLILMKCSLFFHSPDCSVSVIQRMFPFLLTWLTFNPLVGKRCKDLLNQVSRFTVMDPNMCVIFVRTIFPSPLHSTLLQKSL